MVVRIVCGGSCWDGRGDGEREIEDEEEGERERQLGENGVLIGRGWDWVPRWGSWRWAFSFGFALRGGQGGGGCVGEGDLVS